MMNKCYYCFSNVGENGKCLNCGYDNSAYEPKAYHLPIGTAVGGRYIIGAVIGEGGFGITYSAFDKKMNARCAVKEYYPRQISGRGSTDEERTRVFSISGMEHDYAAGLERFQNEAKQLAKFDGIRNIVNVKNYISENGTGYIIMNYVSGISLKNVLEQRGGKLPADETFSLIEPLLRAISVIQRDGIIHRDISPDNIMYSEDKTLVLIDFGSAREYDSEKSMSVILKHGYAPPEQYSSVGKQGPWTDIYSVCATTYRMLTGTVPDEAMDRIDGTAAVKKPSELRVKLPHYREEALMKGLELEIEKRWQTADELYTALYLTQELKKHFPHKIAAALSAAAIIVIMAATVIIGQGNDDSITASVDTTVSFSKSVSATETTVSEISVPKEEYAKEENILNGYYNISGFDNAEEMFFLDNPQHSVIVNGLDIRKIIVGDGITSVTVENAKNLESIELPDSISEAKYYYYNKSNSYYSEKNGKYSNSEIESFNRDYLTVFGELSLASEAKNYPKYGYSSEKESITVPDGFTSVHIDSYVITDLKLPDSVTSLILQNSKLMPAFENFPKSLKYLDMSNSLISSVNIPDSVKWFNFQDCVYLQSVKLPNNLEEMPMSAFNGCTVLREMTIPASVKKICATKDDFNELSDELQAFIKEAHSDEIDHLNSSDFVFPPFSDCSSLETVNIEDGCTLDERNVLFLTASGRYVFNNNFWWSCGKTTELFCNSYSMVIYGKTSNPAVRTACRLLLPVKFTDSQKRRLSTFQRKRFLSARTIMIPGTCPITIRQHLRKIFHRKTGLSGQIQ